MLNSLSHTLSRTLASSVLKRASCHTTLTRTSNSLHQMAFAPTLPVHRSRFLPNQSRIRPSMNHPSLQAPRRPRARMAPAMQAEPAQPTGTGAPRFPATSAPHARPFASMPEIGDDGLPVVEEEDLEEQFVRGSGPGGQKINKTASCVILKHVPTGVTVRCQESRSQVKNRQIARKLLQRKLDEQIRGEESQAARELSKARARKAKRRRKSIKKHFKSRRDKAIMDSRMADY